MGRRLGAWDDPEILASVKLYFHSSRSHTPRRESDCFALEFASFGDSGCGACVVSFARIIVSDLF